MATQENGLKKYSKFFSVLCFAYKQNKKILSTTNIKGKTKGKLCGNSWMIVKVFRCYFWCLSFYFQQQQTPAFQ